jgi:hypothetical protein
MEMLKNKVETVARNNKAADNAAVKLRVISNSPGEVKNAPLAEIMSDGDLWEINLMLGIGNDIY